MVKFRATMSIEDWQELSIKAPTIFGRCMHYFEQNYATNWHQQMNSLDRLLEFFSEEGVGIRIWSSNQEWGYEIYENARRVVIVKNLFSKDIAHREAIKAAFLKSEKDLFESTSSF